MHTQTDTHTYTHTQNKPPRKGKTLFHPRELGVPLLPPADTDNTTHAIQKTVEHKERGEAGRCSCAKPGACLIDDTGEGFKVS